MKETKKHTKTSNKMKKMTYNIFLMSTLKALLRNRRVPCPETLDFCLFEMDTGRVDFGVEKERMRIKVIAAAIYKSFVHNGFKLNTNLILFYF